MSLVSVAISNACELVGLNAKRLAAKAVAKIARRTIMAQLPTAKEIESAPDINISVPIAEKLETEVEKLRGLVQDKNWLALVSHYPVRETGALKAIAVALGFSNVVDYERAVRTMLQLDDVVLNEVSGWFGELGANLRKAD